MYILLHLAMLMGTVLLLARFLPGVRITSTRSAALVAVVFSVLNVLAGWLIKFVLATVLFLPAVLTFGLAWVLVPFVANIILVWITDKVLRDFEVRDGRSLVLAASAITVANAVFRIVLHHG